MTPLFLATWDTVAVLRAVFPFLGILLVVVVVHEIGHYVAARMCGVKVLEFGVGFPPRAWAWKRGETEYSVNWTPLGGFVRLLGEEDPSDPRSLAAQSAGKRLFVMSAGVLMNIALAVLLLSVAWMIPRERDLSLAMIMEVQEGTPAAEAVVTGEMRDGSTPLQGLQPGDLVWEVEGREVRNPSELTFAIKMNLGKTQDWIIQRQNSTLHARVYARWHPPAGQGHTGILIGRPATCTAFDDEGNCTELQLTYPFSETVWYWPWAAVPKGIESLRDTMVLAYSELRVRFGGGGGASSNPDQPAVQSPIGIAQTTGAIIDQVGWRALIELTALLSLNLGIFNALPIPALDGGRMLFVFIELARGGRRISPQKEAIVHLTGMALLLSGVLVIAYFDIVRLVS